MYFKDKTKFHNLRFIYAHAPTKESMKRKRKPFDRKWKKHTANVRLIVLKCNWGDVNAKIWREEVY